MMTDASDRPSIRQRILARLFGGASGGVFRGMATLALGSGIGRVIGLLVIPILTRLYSPEDFGVLAVFTAMVAILAPLVTLRYVMALPLPRHDGVAMNLLAISMGLMFVLSAAVTLVLWLGGEALLSLVSMQMLTPWWWLIPLGVVSTATYEMLTLWATRKRAYKVIAKTNVTQSAAGAVIKIALGIASIQPLGLVVGQIVAQAGGIERLVRSFLSDFRVNWQYISWARMYKVARQHRGFPIWRVPSQFLLIFSQKSAVAFFALSYGPAATGQLAIALLGITVTSNLIGQSLSKSFYGELLVIKEKEEIKSVMKSMMFFIGVTVGPISIIIALFGDAITVAMLGDEWLLAGQFLRILSLYLIFSIAAVSLSSLLNKLGMQFSYFVINFSRALVVFLIFIVASAYEFTPTETIATFSFGMIVLQLLTVVYYFFALERSYR